MSALRRPLVHWVLGIALGVVFVYASLDKIAHPREFARIVYHYQVVGPSAQLGYLPANLVALVLPWVEAVTGLLLIAGVWRREAALAAALMLLVFVGGVSSAMYRGIDIEKCGCFTVSAEGRTAGAKLIAGDVLLLGVALVLTLARPRTSASLGAVAAGADGAHAGATHAPALTGAPGRD